MALERNRKVFTGTDASAVALNAWMRQDEQGRPDINVQQMVHRRPDLPGEPVRVHVQSQGSHAWEPILPGQYVERVLDERGVPVAGEFVLGGTPWVGVESRA